MLTIAGFNWPFYAAALAVVVASLFGLCASSLTMKLFSAAAFVGAGYFLAGSLGVSHLVYDRSDLYRWDWLDRALRGANFRRAIFCHCGFDETSEALRERYSEIEWLTLDHFDERRMTEASIRRARSKYPPAPDTLPCPYDHWTAPDDTADLVLGLLAIHELRSETERHVWFSEARRCLARDGRIVLVEHLRDLPNFIAFGPGFLHFHSRESWRSAWEDGGFFLHDEFGVTPWVRVFVLVPA